MVTMVSVTRIMLRLGNTIMNKAADLVEKLTNILLFQKKLQYRNITKMDTEYERNNVD